MPIVQHTPSLSHVEVPIKIIKLIIMFFLIIAYDCKQIAEMQQEHDSNNVSNIVVYNNNMLICQVS